MSSLNPKNNLESSKINPIINDEENDIPVLDLKSAKQKSYIRGIPSSQYNTNAPQSAINNPEKLEQIRGSNQPWHHETANALVQTGGTFVGDTFSGFGHIFSNSIENENFLEEFGRTISEGSREIAPIYRQNQNETMFGSSEAFFSTIPSIASTLAIMLPVAGTFKAVSLLGKIPKVSKGASVLQNIFKAAPRLSKAQKYVGNGIAQASLSRHIESTMEAGQTYRSLLEQGVDKQEALKASKDVYSKNWLMLGQDIFQYLALGKIFNPIKGKYEPFYSKLGKSKKGQLLGRAKKLGVTAGSEALEEGYQFTVSHLAEQVAKVNAGLIESPNSTLFEEISGDPELFNSMVMGALGGGVFDGIGQALNNRLEKKNRSRNVERNEQFFKNRGALLSGIFKAAEQADQKGDAETGILARKELNTILTQQALLSDNYEGHLEWLSALENASDEELAQISEQYNIEGLSRNVIKEVVPDLIKESEKLKNEFYKLSNKYGNESASIIARNKVVKERLEKSSEATNNKIEELYSKIPNLNKASVNGVRKFEIEAEKKALKKKKNQAVMRSLMLNSHLSEEQAQEEASKNIEEIDNEIQKRVEELDNELKNLPEEKPTESQKQANAELLKYIKSDNGNTANEYAEAKLKKEYEESEISRLENEISFNSDLSNKKQIELTKFKNKINQSESLENIEDLKKEAVDLGLSTNLEETFKNKEKELKDGLNKRFSEIADKVADNLANSNKRWRYISKADIEFVSKEEEKFNSLVEKKLTKLKANDPEFQNPTEISLEPSEEFQPTPKDKVQSNVDIHLARPLKREQNDEYLEFLNKKINIDGYTAVVTNPNDDVLKVTFLDKQGNPVMSEKGNEIYTYLYKKDINDTYRKFREDTLALIKQNGSVKIKVTGKANVKFKKYKNPVEGDIRNIFGKNITWVYTNEEGEYVYANEKEALYQTKEGVKPVTQTGTVFIEVINNNGQRVPVKVNRRKLQNKEIDLIYDLYVELLNTGDPSEEISEALLKRLDENEKQLIESFYGDLSYSSVIDFFVYESLATKNFPKNRLFTDYNKNSERVTKVYFGGETSAIQLNKDNLAEKEKSFKDFLRNSKRRNIKVKMLNNSSYEEYVITEKLLSSEKVNGVFHEVGTIEEGREIDESNESVGGDIFIENFAEVKPELENPASNKDFGFSENEASVERMDVDEVFSEETTTTTSTQSTEAKKAEIERRREEELDENSYRIIEKRTTKTWKDDSGNTVKTIVHTNKDGSHVVYDEITNSKTGETARTPKDKYPKENKSEDLLEKLTDGEGTINVEKTPSSKAVSKTNAKYDAELKALESITEKAYPSGTYIVKVNQYKITINPDGSMFYANGDEITNEKIKRKALVKKEIKLFPDNKVTLKSGNSYFKLSNNEIVSLQENTQGNLIKDKTIIKKVNDKISNTEESIKEKPKAWEQSAEFKPTAPDIFTEAEKPEINKENLKENTTTKTNKTDIVGKKSIDKLNSKLKRKSNKSDNLRNLPDSNLEKEC